MQHIPPPRPGPGPPHGPEGQCAAANAAMRRANEAWQRADSAHAAHFSVNEALGGVMRELSGIRGEVKSLAYKMSDIRRRSNDSKHELDDLREETSQVRDLKHAIIAAQNRIKASEDTARGYRRVMVNLVIGVLVIVLGAAIAKVLHLVVVGSTEGDSHELDARAAAVGLETHGHDPLSDRFGGR